MNNAPKEIIQKTENVESIISLTETLYTIVKTDKAILCLDHFCREFWRLFVGRVLVRRQGRRAKISSSQILVAVRIRKEPKRWHQNRSSSSCFLRENRPDPNPQTRPDWGDPRIWKNDQRNIVLVSFL